MHDSLGYFGLMGIGLMGIGLTCVVAVDCLTCNARASLNQADGTDFVCRPLHHGLTALTLVECCRYVYQKAYVEFFVSPEKLDGLEQRLQQQPSITYMAINSKGKVR